jgi:hypothetical protein
MKPASGASKRKRKKEREENEAAGRKTLFECWNQAKKRPNLNRNVDEHVADLELSVTCTHEVNPTVVVAPQSEPDSDTNDSQTSLIIADTVSEPTVISTEPVSTSLEHQTKSPESHSKPSDSANLREKRGSFLLLVLSFCLC